MNKNRREQLVEVETTIEEAKDQIQDIIDEEQEALDNLPDAFQDSERGQKMAEAISDMEGLIESLDNFNIKLSEVVKKHSPQKRKTKNRYGSEL